MSNHWSLPSTSSSPTSPTTAVHHLAQQLHQTCIAETFPKLARPDRWGESGDCYLLNILHVFYTFCPKTKQTQWLWNSHSLKCQCLELPTKLNSKRMKAQKTAPIRKGKMRKNKKHKRQHLCGESVPQKKAKI